MPSSCDRWQPQGATESHQRPTEPLGVSGTGNKLPLRPPQENFFLQPSMSSAISGTPLSLLNAASGQKLLRSVGEFPPKIRVNKPPDSLPRSGGALAAGCRADRSTVPSAWLPPPPQWIKCWNSVRQDCHN